MTWISRGKIVVPFDFSEASINALQEAAALATDPEQLHVVHVMAALHPSEPGIVWDSINDDHRRAHVLEALEPYLVGKLQAVHRHVRMGAPAIEIVAVVKRVHADLVVMSTHGRTGFARLGIGSVAERVVRLSPCPVLVLPTPRKA